MRRPVLPGLHRLGPRRTLAKRVIALTTVAVALSVALVALAAFLTVRHQLATSLDESLHKRASDSARYDPTLYPPQNIPAFMARATDTKVGYLLADGNCRLTGTQCADFPLGAPELAVARGAAGYSCRTITFQGVDYRVATVPDGAPGHRPGHRPVAGAEPAHPRHPRPGHAAGRRRRSAGRGTGGLGRGAQRPASGPSA